MDGNKINTIHISTLGVKKLNKHIRKLQFVKAYICDKNEQSLTHFEGIIFNQNEDYMLMCDLSDFNYDGFVILRKEDVLNIKRSENEKFFNRILQKEKIVKEIHQRHRDLDFKLGTLEKMFFQLKKMGIATIVECLYNSEEAFQIGPVINVKEKKMKMDYFNSRGEFDVDSISIKYKDITFFRIDSPYANLFFKYAVQPKEKEKIKVKKNKDSESSEVQMENTFDQNSDNKNRKSKSKQTIKSEKKKRGKNNRKSKQTERLMLVV